MDLHLKDKVVIVTGAARGIGRTTALTFANEGANVVIDDIDIETAKTVEEEVKAFGVQATSIEADVTKPNEVRNMMKETFKKFGRIDVLVNNVGILYVKGKPIGRGPFVQTEEEIWKLDIDVTLYGVLNCCKAVLEYMIKQKNGSIVSLASDAARQPRNTFTSVYAAGKGGIISFTKNLAFELGPLGIRVNCVSPGTIKTSRIEAVESGQDTRPDTVAFVKNTLELASRWPLGRLGTPQEVANAITFLASDVSSYITGQTLSVNGGFVMP